MLEDGHNLSIITSQWSKSIPFAKKWLKQKGLNVPIIGVGKGKPKNEACADLDVYVDDELKKLIDLSTPERIWLCRFPLLGSKTPKGITLATSWYHLYQEIQKIAKLE